MTGQMTYKAALLAAGLLALPASAQDGAALFDDYCAACHDVGGAGIPGLAPPLDRPEFWQAFDDGQAADFLGGVMTKGFNMTITVRGEKYMGMIMPPVSAAEDAELAAISSWVLSTLGGSEQTVTAEQITALRTSSIGTADLRAMRPESE